MARKCLNCESHKAMTASKARPLRLIMPVRREGERAVGLALRRLRRSGV